MLTLFLCCVAVAATRAEILGGFSDVDPSSAQDVIDFAETTLNARSNSIFLHRVANVLSVRRQLVNGFNYQIEFIYGLTKCTRQQVKQLSSCKTDSSRDQQCSVRVYESFSGEKSLDDFSCKPSDGMAKRAGGLKTEHNLEQFTDTAIRALSMSNAALSNVKVVAAKTQVVAGQKIMLGIVGDAKGKEDTRCVLHVWSRPWLTGDEGFKVTFFNCKPNSKRIVKRVGGVQKADNPQDFTDTAIRALAMSNAALNNVKVISAKTQVVAGQKIMLVIVGDANGKEDTRCELGVWSRPWIGGDEGFKVTKFSCKPNSKSKRAVLGGVTGGISQDLLDKDQYLDTAKKALSMTNTALKDLEVVRARTQTVAGKNYYLTVRGKEFGKVKQCDMVIWSRPWLTGAEAFKLTDFTCSDSSRKREVQLERPCAGCISDEVDNPKDYMDLYIRAVGLSNANLDTDNTKILSVKTQVVAGTKYYMKVRTSEAGEARICDVQFVVAPWMDPDMSNVTFNCKPEA